MKLKIEGKLRDGFFEWFKKRYYHSWELSWSVYPQSAQFGLLQEYADTLGYKISIYWREIDDDWFGYIGIESISESFFTSRPEAQVAAIEKLNEIVNQLKDK